MVSPEKPPTTTRRKVLKATGAGAVGTTGLATFTGTAKAHCDDSDCIDCTLLGKIDETPSKGDIYCFEVSDAIAQELGSDEVCVEITDVVLEDGEVVAVDVKVLDDPEAWVVICRVDVKGGPKEVTYDCTENFDCCPSTATDLFAPEHNSPQREFYELSHLTLYTCEWEQLQ